MLYSKIFKPKKMTLFYKQTGQGRPIILLHGNGEDHRIFDILTQQLSAHFTVYALDSRGYGKSPQTNDFHYSLMAEDVVKFIEEKQLERPILYGFSDGGIIGLLIASRYPKLLSRLIISGANSSPKGLKWHWRALACIHYFFTRSAKTQLMIREPNITKNDLHKIDIPTLVLAGENDIIKTSDTHFIAQNISRSTLNILPKENHDSYVVNSPKLFGIIEKFIGLK